MALTVTPRTPDAIPSSAGEARWHATFTCDTAYPKNAQGYTMPGNFKIQNKFKTVLRVSIPNWNGYQFYYNTTTNRLRVFSGSIEVENNQDISFITGVRITVEGLIQ